ncbi:hypothetical protein F442_10843 [Phytophthora nicotianae P10297]|uniref:Uncharacterized protein n=1 Tax=Phytophthora nicotianae P10297 TaxID=1317064 RepID=W2Z4G3_PHYNI|nr:hypothetical protein F442_10843 [Phytophthora nicotianae P10297]
MTVITSYVIKAHSLETIGYAYGKPVSDAEHEGDRRIGASYCYRGRSKERERYVCGRCGVYHPGSEEKTKVWDYDVVVGYSWKDRRGTLQFTFSDGTSELDFREDEIQDFALETYGLRPCQAARTSSAKVLKKLSMTPVDESQDIPLFDAGDERLRVLLYRNVLITSVEEANEVMRSEQQPAGNLEEENIEQLGDSDDDLLPSEGAQHDLSGKMNKTGKHARDTEAPQPSGDARPLTMRRRLGDDPRWSRRLIK